MLRLKAMWKSLRLSSVAAAIPESGPNHWRPTHQTSGIVNVPNSSDGSIGAMPLSPKKMIDHSISQGTSDGA